MKKITFVKNSAIVTAFCLLVGCASPYQPSGLGGGYTDMALNKDTYFVTFRGNGLTSSDVVESYVLRRSAELTLSKGYKYFVILNGGTDKSSQLIQTPATVHTESFGNFEGNGRGNAMYYGNSVASNYNFSGNTRSSSYTTINPGNQFIVSRYKSGITIKMLHTNKGYQQVYDAGVILSNYRK